MQQTEPTNYRMSIGAMNTTKSELMKDGIIISLERAVEF